MSNPALTVLVVGAGALGSAVAALLQDRLGRHAGPPVRVHLLARGGIPAGSFSLELPEGGSLRFPEQGDFPAIGAAGAVLVLSCTKAFDLQAVAMEWLARLVPGRDVFVSLSNGYLGRVFEALNVPQDSDGILRWGITTIGVTKIGSGRFRGVNFRRGLLAWGPAEISSGAGMDGVTASEAEKLFTAAFPGFGPTPRAAALIAEKWVCNAALNTLCGALRLGSNSLALARHPEMLAAAFADAYECAATELFPSLPLAPPDEIWARLTSLIADTGENTNSMAADVAAGRRTEKDYLAGACRCLRSGSALAGLQAQLP